MLRFCLFILFVGLSLASTGDNTLSDSDESYEKNSINKKGPMAGAPNQMDLTKLDNLQKVQNLTDFSIKMLNQKSNDMFHSSRIRVVDASRQLVAGLKYQINFYMGQTDCAKNKVRHEQITQTLCPISDKTEAKFYQCKVSIWEKPWQNFLSVTSDECNIVPREEAMQNAK